MDHGNIEFDNPASAPYGFETPVKGDMAAAVERVTAALKEEGFGVLCDIDVQAALKAKLNVDRRPYRILGACNPALARQALDADPAIGLLLPCNVVVREDDDGHVRVAFMDPVAVLALVNNPTITKLAWDVKARLERVRDRLGA